MTDTALREKVARAIDAARGPNDSIYDYADAAIAAVLEALQTPTEAMLEAGNKWTNHHADCVYNIWQAMLTAYIEGNAK